MNKNLINSHRLKRWIHSKMIMLWKLYGCDNELVLNILPRNNRTN